MSYVNKTGIVSNDNSYSTALSGSTSCTISSNEQIILSVAMGQAAGSYNAIEDEITLQPGETMTLAARAVTGTATYIIGSLNTREDQ